MSDLASEGPGGPDVLLSGFDPGDLGAAAHALSSLGRGAAAGDPVSDPRSAFVLAAAYDEPSLRAARAAALGDSRPWCFCVPAQARALVAAASAAREGLLLLLPPDRRELRRVLSSLSEEARERGAAGAAFSGLERLEARFAWRTGSVDVGMVARRIARLLAESGLYGDRAGEDECALALEEALVNAVEHGNLALDSSLRSYDPLSEDRYGQERARRLADPAYADKLVRATLVVSGGEAQIVLEDEGAGFDLAALEGAAEAGTEGGKGLWLIRKPFDVATYEAGGRRLTLVRRRDAAR
jgi:hypothetical protein